MKSSISTLQSCIVLFHKLVRFNKIRMSIEKRIKVPNWLMLEGRCNVFQQFIELIIISILINPMQIKIEATSIQNYWKHNAP